MGDTGAEEQEGGGVRSTLVTSLAANIFDTLKSNDDIATILNGVLDPARKDKVYLILNSKCSLQLITSRRT